ncbi:MAG: hypothetical protein ACREOW_11505 [Thermodesulfobacteriota bacterium]
MTTTLDYELAIRLVECLAAVGVIISSAEFLSNRGIFDDTNFMGWKVAQLHHPILRKEPLGKFLTLVNKNIIVYFLIVARILAAVALFFASYQQHLLRFIFDATIAFSLMALMVRATYGRDGANKMMLIIFVAISISLVSGSKLATMACLFIIAGQACLSYFATGFAKANSQRWRKGKALIDIMSTSLWGNQNIAKMLVTRKWLALLITYSIITFESSFPLVLLVPSQIVLLFLSLGVLFHLANAFVMGLNYFVWAFVATYPAVLYTSELVSRYLSLHISSSL